MATVYQAKLASRKGFVALKIAHDKPRDYASLQKEAQVLQELDHPNIVKIVPLPAGEVGQGVYVKKTYIGGEPKCYIALEYVDGYSLRRRLKQPKPLTVPEIANIVRQVGSALSYAHARGIIHLDIKPSNILLARNGRHVVLTDFGIVRPADPRLRDRSERLVGSAGYMSPEHATGGNVDYRSDIFSLGVVLYEMLTGKPPFKGETTSQTLAAVIHAHPPLPSTLNSALSPELDQVVQTALAKDRRDRFQRTRDLVDALGKAVPRPAIDRRPILAGAAVVTGLALVWLLWPHGDGLQTKLTPAPTTPVPGLLTPPLDKTTITVVWTPTGNVTGRATTPRPTDTSTPPPTQTLPPTPTPAETATRVDLTPTTPAATVTPPFVYPVPTLAQPPNGVPPHPAGKFVLEWDSVGTLAGDEWYRIEVWKDQQPVVVYWSQAEQYPVPRLDQGDGHYNWQVTIVRRRPGVPDTAAEPLSPPSERWGFWWREKAPEEKEKPPAYPPW
jgi:serine/threonine protein kinase